MRRLAQSSCIPALREGGELRPEAPVVILLGRGFRRSAVAARPIKILAAVMINRAALATPMIRTGKAKSPGILTRSSAVPHRVIPAAKDGTLLSGLAAAHESKTPSPIANTRKPTATRSFPVRKHRIASSAVAITSTTVVIFEGIHEGHGRGAGTDHQIICVDFIHALFYSQNKSLLFGRAAQQVDKLASLIRHSNIIPYPIEAAPLGDHVQARTADHPQNRRARHLPELGHERKFAAKIKRLG
jgi:hypothetical protein